MLTDSSRRDVEIKFKPIGLIRTPFDDISGMPIQPTGAEGVRGTIDIFPEYVPGLMDLEGFSHIILLYHLHKIKSASLVVRPFLDSKEHGIFATRAPRRPNPIGFSVVKLVEIQKESLSIENVDILDRTPLIDIKPYLPEFDHFAADRLGWYETVQGKVATHRSDSRFR